MGEFKGQMQVPGVVDWPLSVRIELEEEQISIAAAGYEVGTWSLDEVEIKTTELRGGIWMLEGRGGNIRLSHHNDVLPAWMVELALDRETPMPFGDGEFDLVLMDCQMPVMDGMELLKILRRKHPSLPVVVVTAVGDEKHLRIQLNGPDKISFNLVILFGFKVQFSYRIEPLCIIRMVDN